MSKDKNNSIFLFLWKEWRKKYFIFEKTWSYNSCEKKFTFFHSCQIKKIRLVVNRNFLLFSCQTVNNDSFDGGPSLKQQLLFTFPSLIFAKSSRSCNKIKINIYIYNICVTISLDIKELSSSFKVLLGTEITVNALTECCLKICLNFGLSF